MTTSSKARSWCRFRRDTEGFALVEFAVALPVMLVAYCGTVDVAQMVMANRKVTQLTLALADLSARHSPLPPAEIDNIFKAAQAVLMPFDSANISMVISSVVIDAEGIAKVCWSNAPPNGQALARGTTVPLPDSIRVPSTSVIMAKASYTYTPMFGNVLTGTFTLGGDPIYTRPRSGQAVGSASIEQVVRTGTLPCPDF
ncbi:TadE/TadG family type IV pilus assembly protein [Bosea sp. UNC402CLCol]|uniref:TadE/TadG family type IV pilus assembly protein n=1 Tax=Bosea sp. UNC402CLCol TaxID=1510531 RepID=UPI0005702763|nr:TadE/TadG family type IV pilus assembly protein [Bosea sp. UNC402CLCol]